MIGCCHIQCIFINFIAKTEVKTEKSLIAFELKQHLVGIVAL